MGKTKKDRRDSTEPRPPAEEFFTLTPGGHRYRKCVCVTHTIIHDVYPGRCGVCGKSIEPKALTK